MINIIVLKLVYDIWATDIVQTKLHIIISTMCCNLSPQSKSIFYQCTNNKIRNKHKKFSIIDESLVIILFRIIPTTQFKYGIDSFAFLCCFIIKYPKRCNKSGIIEYLKADAEKTNNNYNFISFDEKIKQFVSSDQNIIHFEICMNNMSNMLKTATDLIDSYCQKGGMTQNGNNRLLLDLLATYTQLKECYHAVAPIFICICILFRLLDYLGAKCIRRNNIFAAIIICTAYTLGFVSDVFFCNAVSLTSNTNSYNRCSTIIYYATLIYRY